MDDNSPEQKTSFRYLLVLYIVLFVVSVPLFIFSIPSLEESIMNTGIYEHFLLWRKNEGRSDRSVSVTLLSYWGEVESRRTIEPGFRDDLHTVAEAILMPLSREEKKNGYISPIASGTKLVGAVVVDSIPFLSLSEEFLETEDMAGAASVIEKTLRANLGTEGLVILVGDETVVSM
ncbi:MAG: hypothetical protein ACI4S4_07600 [Candidatus Ornithospirochaeta sp.]